MGLVRDLDPFYTAQGFTPYRDCWFSAFRTVCGEFGLTGEAAAWWRTVGDRIELICAIDGLPPVRAWIAESAIDKGDEVTTAALVGLFRDHIRARVRPPRRTYFKRRRK